MNGSFVSVGFDADAWFVEIHIQEQVNGNAFKSMDKLKESMKEGMAQSLDQWWSAVGLKDGETMEQMYKRWIGLGIMRHASMFRSQG